MRHPDVLSRDALWLLFLAALGLASILALNQLWKMDHSTTLPVVVRR
jgi:hypothetical protein